MNLYFKKSIAAVIENLNRGHNKTFIIDYLCHSYIGDNEAESVKNSLYFRDLCKANMIKHTDIYQHIIQSIEFEIHFSKPEMERIAINTFYIFNPKEYPLFSFREKQNIKETFFNNFYNDLYKLARNRKQMEEYSYIVQLPLVL